MIEFEIEEYKFKMLKLPALKQFSISRKIAPLLPSLIPVFIKLSKDENLNKDISQLAEMIQPFADGLAGLKDEDANAVFSDALSCVMVNMNGNWTAVWNVNAQASMVEELDLGILIRLVIKVIKESLGSFIKGFLTGQKEAQAA